MTIINGVLSGPQGPQGDVGDTGPQGPQGVMGASAVAGKIPNSYIELATQQTTTSAVLEDVSTMSVDIILDQPVEITVNASFEIATASGASASTIAIAVNIDGTDHDEYTRYLSGNNDTGIGAIVHRSDVLSAGSHTVKLRFRRVSGVSVPAINKADMLVIAMQSAIGETGPQGDTGPQGPQGVAGADGETIEWGVGSSEYTTAGDSVIFLRDEYGEYDSRYLSAIIGIELIALGTYNNRSVYSGYCGPDLNICKLAYYESGGLYYWVLHEQNQDPFTKNICYRQDGSPSGVYIWGGSYGAGASYRPIAQQYAIATAIRNRKIPYSDKNVALTGNWAAGSQGPFENNLGGMDSQNEVNLWLDGLDVPNLSGNSMTYEGWNLASTLPVGSVVKVDTTYGYAKAQADSASNAESVGIVTTCDTTNDIIIVTFSGVADIGDFGLTYGATYYLSATTAGAYTTTAPTTTGEVVKPVFISVGSADGKILILSRNGLEVS